MSGLHTVDVQAPWCKSMRCWSMFRSRRAPLQTLFDPASGTKFRHCWQHWSQDSTLLLLPHLTASPIGYLRKGTDHDMKQIAGNFSHHHAVCSCKPQKGESSEDDARRIWELSIQDDGYVLCVSLHVAGFDIRLPMPFHVRCFCCRRGCRFWNHVRIGAGSIGCGVSAICRSRCGARLLLDQAAADRKACTTHIEVDSELAENSQGRCTHNGVLLVMAPC